MPSTISDPALPSLGQLWRATAIALAVAAVVLVTIVLPSEYGIDPTGVGRRLGVFRPAATEIAAPVADAGADLPLVGAPLRKSEAPFRSDETTIVLQPGEGTERKAVMAAGQMIVFSWTATGGLDLDMHGEVLNAPEGEFTSYWKDEGRTSAHGSFVAPKTGLHGWFWQNLNDAPVTITLKTSGYYDKLVIP
ncbi:MAG TPA: hypothetical protein VNJ02_19435 [Vicinamibacterales bacterium]|nr:hypothetical protein [Vicinamibacterales bacterium]